MNNPQISEQYDAELDAARNLLMEMGGLVEQQLHDATQALIRSRNVPAVALASKLGSPGFYDFLRRGGVARMASEEHYGLALVLGGGETTIEEMTRLYALLPNRGRLRPLRYLADDPRSADGEALLSEEASFMVLDMLRQNPRPDDLVIQGVANIIQDTCRASDVCCRWSGTGSWSTSEGTCSSGSCRQWERTGTADSTSARSAFCRACRRRSRTSRRSWVATGSRWSFRSSARCSSGSVPPPRSGSVRRVLRRA